jgi:hypothetical protein
MSSSIPDPVPPHATPEQLRHIINYWRIEANHNYGRWIAAADELNELRKSSFVTAVPSEDYEKLKAENERQQNVIAKLFDQRSALRSENERLRKEAAKEGTDK